MHTRTDFPEGIDGLASGMGAGSVSYVRTLMIIGALVLLIACVNFMNLATAQATKRAQEVGVRKAIGAGRSQLAIQFFCESAVLSLMSLPIAWILVQFMLPTWNSFIGNSFPIDPAARPQILIGIACVVLFIGLLSGSYPALYLSSFRPSLTLRGINTTDRTGSLRKGLVILQFGIAILLVAGSLVAWNQLTFFSRKDLGFDKEDIITLSFFDVNGSLRPQYPEIKARLANHPDVIGVFASASRPGEGWTRDRRRYESPARPGRQFEMSNYSVDEGFFDALGIEIVAGRNFSTDRASDQETAFILNETAVGRLGLEDPLGQPFTWKDAVVRPGYGRADSKEGFIIGVVKDFHARRLQERIAPIVFAMDPRRFRIVSVKVRDGTLPTTMSHFEDVWSQYITNRPLHFYFLDDRLERGYRTERRYQRILAVSFGLAIFIACLGLTGLASYTAEQRTKEIGIRKTLGATAANIVTLLSGEFIGIILIANLVALPFAWYLMSGWLDAFAYRIDLTLWPFLLAALLSLAFASATVGSQAYRAAKTDPIDALRYE